MPSKKSKAVKKHKENLVEEKQHKHPFLWGFSITILILIVVTFIGAPLMRGLTKQGGSIIFGQYDGEDITFTPDNYFARQVDSFNQKYQNSQTNQTNYKAQSFQIWKSAFDATVYHMAILKSALKSGLHISEHRIDKALTQYGPYMDNGKFSPELYKSASNADRYRNRQIFREELIQQQYTSDIQSRLVSSEEIKFIKGMSSPERNFEYAVFKFDDYPKEEVVKFAKKNEKLFTQINVNRITLKNDEKAAKAIYKELKDTPSRFEELAQNQSTDIYADKGGDMGWTKYYTLKSDFSDQKDLDKLFALNAGDLSQLIKTPYGFSIYRCNKSAQKPDFTSSDLVKDVRSYLLTTEKGKIEDYFVAKGNEFKKIAVKKGFEQAGDSMGVTYHITDYFPINYGNSYFMKQIKTIDNSKELSSVATDERALKALFSIKKNELTDPLILDTSVVVARMINERAVDPKSLTFIDSYYSYLLSQFRQEELYKMFLSSKKLKNNFIPVFTSTILRNR